MTEVLAIIPGKGISTRVPNKNLRTLGGKPLIAWTVEAALGARTISRTVVSTESHTVAAVAQTWGADVVSHPPLEDLPEVPDVCLHVLDVLEAQGYVPDVVCCLLPTSPFRRAHHIDEAVEYARGRTVLSVSQPRHHIGVVVEGLSIHRDPEHNGAILIATTSDLRRDGFFNPSQALPYWLDPISGIDINTEQDLKYAERIVARGAA